MRFAALLFLLTSAVAFAAPALTTQTQDGVTLAVPSAWKLLVTSSEHNVVMSRDSTTTINVHWYTYKEGVSVDRMLDKLVSVTDANVPFGDVKETKRYDVLGGKGKVAEADYLAPLGYTMKMGFAVIPDKARGRIHTAIFLAPPEVWTEVGGGDLLARITDGVASVP